MTSQPINPPKPHQKVELVTLNKFAKFHHYTPNNKKLRWGGGGGHFVTGLWRAKKARPRWGLGQGTPKLTIQKRNTFFQILLGWVCVCVCVGGGGGGI